MSDPSSVLRRYEDVCEEMEVKPTPFIMKVVEKEKDDQITRQRKKLDPKDNMELVLRGNNYLLTDTRLNDSDMLALYKTLVNSVYVTGLDLRYNNITDEGAVYIGDLLEKTCALRSLNLQSNDIKSAGAEVIAKALQVNETLTSLKLNGNKIENKGGMFLAGCLQVNTCLQELDVGDADLGTQSLIAFATVLHHNNTLRALCVNRPILFSQQEETTVHMALMLKVNCTLQELHLQKCDIRDFGADRLVEALQHNISLKYLDVSCNRITRDGAKSLAKLLKQNTPLEILDLGYNRIEDDGAVYLSESLAGLNSNLKTLVITSNNIEAAGLCAIARSMNTNTTLTSVFIWGNHLQELACVAFNGLVESGRLDMKDTDVKPYIVDGHVMLSQLNHGIRRHYYWTPFFGPDAE
ncbi:leucine-rich repeat-containing protein 34-like isoform X1 [Asterias rubens]|uniref:leucine-rich repeat-containing protein 34-like isoform X1 n=1 Tax=Asterias rubens TaxID=7604 RepID=UPI00145587AC|nr:leucine-rich repeat-containing protein 34-like isoform X1 [Asterias rubens]XP_033644831.1 leucine-rich repeat-containing protein 34-like isoform X1 [Asterias rubens]